MMIRTVFVTSGFCVALLADGASASARGLSAMDAAFCAGCAPRGVVGERGIEAAPRASYRQSRGEAWAMYRARPYTRFDVEGIRIIERMR